MDLGGLIRNDLKPFDNLLGSCCGLSSKNHYDGLDFCHLCYSINTGDKYIPESFHECDKKPIL